MKIWQRLFRFFGVETEPKTGPESVKCPARYRAELNSAFWVAVAKLENNGLCFGHKHTIRQFRAVPGATLRPRGWAVWLPGGIAAGAWTTGEAISAAVCPATGDLNKGAKNDLAHEWGHALLDGAKISRGDWQAQNLILQTAGL